MQVQCKKIEATYLEERWYLSAIDYLIIDTQVARRGRQYHSNPPPYKNRPTKATVLQNIQQERLEKKIKQINKKNIDKKTACPIHRVLQKKKPSYKKQPIYKISN